MITNKINNTKAKAAPDMPHPQLFINSFLLFNLYTFILWQKQNNVCAYYCVLVLFLLLLCSRRKIMSKKILIVSSLLVVCLFLGGCGAELKNGEEAAVSFNNGAISAND